MSARRGRAFVTRKTFPLSICVRGATAPSRNNLREVSVAFDALSKESPVLRLLRVCEVLTLQCLESIVSVSLTSARPQLSPPLNTNTEFEMDTPCGRPQLVFPVDERSRQVTVLKDASEIGKLYVSWSVAVLHANGWSFRGYASPCQVSGYD